MPATARHPFAVVVLALLASPVSFAQDANDNSVNCALIRDGVQRLACYDAQNDRQKAREQASEEALESSEAQADKLAADKEHRKSVVQGRSVQPRSGGSSET